MDFSGIFLSPSDDSRKESGKHEVLSTNLEGDGDEDWLQIHEMHSRYSAVHVGSYRDFCEVRVFLSKDCA